MQPDVQPLGELAEAAAVSTESLPPKPTLTAALREAALMPGSERDLFYEEHPVVRNMSAIATPPLREAYDLVAQVLVHRDPGTCLIGEFRMGKTTAQAIIINTLAETFPNVPVGSVIAKRHDTPTEKSFYTDLLTDYKHSGARTGYAVDRRVRLLSMILAEARQRKSNRYLLLVDEGQNWDEAEFTFLRDITNDWQKDGLTVITVIFAHPELYALRQRLLTKRRTDLVGRFLLSPFEFRGIRDQSELRETLQAYDDPGRHQYPSGSDISYSEFFMPQAWSAGWRLESETAAFWDAISRVASRSGRPAGNVGMTWISAAIRNFFFYQAPVNGFSFVSSPNTWLEAVEVSGFESSLM